MKEMNEFKRIIIDYSGALPSNLSKIFGSVNTYGLGNEFGTSSVSDVLYGRNHGVTSLDIRPNMIIRTLSCFTFKDKNIELVDDLGQDFTYCGMTYGFTLKNNIPTVVNIGILIKSNIVKYDVDMTDLENLYIISQFIVNMNIDWKSDRKIGTSSMYNIIHNPSFVTRPIISMDVDDNNGSIMTSGKITVEFPCKQRKQFMLEINSDCFEFESTKKYIADTDSIIHEIPIMYKLRKNVMSKKSNVAVTISDYSVKHTEHFVFQINSSDISITKTLVSVNISSAQVFYEYEISFTNNSTSPISGLVITDVFGSQNIVDFGSILVTTYTPVPGTLPSVTVTGVVNTNLTTITYNDPFPALTNVVFRIQYTANLNGIVYPVSNTATATITGTGESVSDNYVFYADRPWWYTTLENITYDHTADNPGLKGKVVASIGDIIRQHFYVNVPPNNGKQFELSLLGSSMHLSTDNTGGALEHLPFEDSITGIEATVQTTPANTPSYIESITKFPFTYPFVRYDFIDFASQTDIIVNNTSHGITQYSWSCDWRVSNSIVNQSSVEYVIDTTPGITALEVRINAEPVFLPPEPTLSVLNFYVVEPNLTITKTLASVQPSAIEYNIVVNNPLTEWTSSAFQVLLYDNLPLDQPYVSDIVAVTSADWITGSTAIPHLLAYNGKVLPGATLNLTACVLLQPGFPYETTNIKNKAYLTWRSVDTNLVESQYARSGTDLAYNEKPDESELGEVYLVNDYYAESTIVTGLGVYGISKFIYSDCVCCPHVGDSITYGILVTVPPGSGTVTIEDLYTGLFYTSTQLVTTATYPHLQYDFDGNVSIVTNDNGTKTTIVATYDPGNYPIQFHTEFLLLVTYSVNDVPQITNQARLVEQELDTPVITNTTCRPELVIIKSHDEDCTDGYISTTLVVYHTANSNDTAAKVLIRDNSTDETLIFSDITIEPFIPGTVILNPVPIVGGLGVDIPEIPQDVSVIVKYKFKQANPNTECHQNQATVYWTNMNDQVFPPNHSSTSQLVPYCFTAGQLKVEKEPCNCNVSPGDMVLWHIKVSNTGCLPITDITVTDDNSIFGATYLPEFSTPGWSFPILGSESTFQIPLLNPGETIELDFAYLLPIPYNFTTHNNHVDVQGTTAGNTVQAFSEGKVYVSGWYSLLVKKYIGPESDIKLGGIVTYYIDITNIGNKESPVPLWIVDTYSQSLTWNGGGTGGWVKTPSVNELVAEHVTAIQPNKTVTLTASFDISNDATYLSNCVELRLTRDGARIEKDCVYTVIPGTGPQGPQGPQGPEGPPGVCKPNDCDPCRRKPCFEYSSSSSSSEIECVDYSSYSEFEIKSTRRLG